ncbi:MAG: response regulator transcription factor [Anaeromyxobacteraceae bacterium]
MSTPRVLLVDDDREICTFLATLLELEGMEPVVARRAEEALERYRDAAAVLVDVAMPGMDGLELCRRMRAGGFTGPILVVSARPGPDLPRRSIEAGANGFVRKPFENTELVARLRQLMAG